MNKGHSLSWQAALLLPFVAGFLGTLVSIAVSGSAHALASGSTSTEAKTAIRAVAPISAPRTPASVNSDGAANLPARLIIPSIGVNAAVQSVGLSKTGSGAIGVPSNFIDVAWYSRSVVPGDQGIAIIDGHLDGRTVPEAVFYHLGDLTEGESIYVKDRLGVQQRFVVTKRQQLAYDADTSILFAPSDTPQLALITCAGDWQPDKHQYSDRIVVFATLSN